LKLVLDRVDGDGSGGTAELYLGKRRLI
jgi:hypothetical protein